MKYIRTVRNILAIVAILFGIVASVQSIPENIPQQQAPTPATTTSSTAASTSALTTYQVVHVVDGDTIDVLIGTEKKRIRMIGIDTPEVAASGRPVGCFGDEASNRAKELLDGKNVRLESDPVAGDKDKFSRLLRYVFFENGENFELQMIQEGFAKEYTYRTQKYKYRPEFQKAQIAAQSAQVGMWSPANCSPR